AGRRGRREGSRPGPGPGGHVPAGAGGRPPAGGGPDDRQAVTRRIPFRVRLLVPVGDMVERRGWLLEGPAGWGECSPLPSWSKDERAAAERAAREAADLPSPAPTTRSVQANARIPRIAPATAARSASPSTSRTRNAKAADELGARQEAGSRCGVR